MLYMLDTNICSYIMRLSPLSVVAAAKDRVRGGHELCISAVTYEELIFGAGKKGGAEGEKHLLRIYDLLDTLDHRVAAWDARCAERSAVIRAALGENSGIGRADAMIAAHALALNAIIVTNDKDFQRIREAGGPPWENWVR